MLTTLSGKVSRSRRERLTAPSAEADLAAARVGAMPRGPRADGTRTPISCRASRNQTPEAPYYNDVFVLPGIVLETREPVRPECDPPIPGRWIV
jgi:hypothetical protein